VLGCEDETVLYKKSSIPSAGNGVFTNADIRKGDVITIYSGERVDEKPKSPEYVIQLQDGSYLLGDSNPQVGNGLGSFINRSSVKKNCEIVENEDYQQLVVVATKKIKKVFELFSTYSRGYRLKRMKVEWKPAFLLPSLQAYRTLIDFNSTFYFIQFFLNLMDTSFSSGVERQTEEILLVSVEIV